MGLRPTYSQVLLWAWFALGFNHVDDPLDLVVAVVWWLAVAAVVADIVWADTQPTERRPAL